MNINRSIRISAVSSLGGEDWIEIYNASLAPVNIAGWYVADNKGLARKPKTMAVPAGTILERGETYLFRQGEEFHFGLGKNDTAFLYNNNDELVDSLTWSNHADAVFGKDEEGNYVRDPLLNIQRTVVISESGSHPGAEWIEVYNSGEITIDVSGWFVTDNKGLKRLKKQKTTALPAGSRLKPGEIYIFNRGKDFNFKFSENDTAMIFNAENQLIDSIRWHESEDIAISASTYTNDDEFKEWPGLQGVKIVDNRAWFYENASGLNYGHDGLYIVDNSNGRIWRVELAEDGTPIMPSGTARGKKIIYRDKDNNPHMELNIAGVTHSSDDKLFLALENDVNRLDDLNKILMIDLVEMENSEYAFVKKVWDLEELLPVSDSEQGVESVQWTPIASLDNHIIDLNTGEGFDHTKYPNAQSDGLFFVAHEASAKILIFVLQEDGTAILINKFETDLNGAVGQIFDPQALALWITTNDDRDGRMARIMFKEGEDPHIEYFASPKFMGTYILNNEGFAISKKQYNGDGTRPVYWVHDSKKKKSLRMGYIAYDDLYAK